MTEAEEHAALERRMMALLGPAGWPEVTAISVIVGIIWVVMYLVGALS